MALLFADGADHYGSSNVLQKWNAHYSGYSSTPTVAGPGRLGYGQYLNVGYGASCVASAIGTNTTLIAGAACYNPTTTWSSQDGMVFVDVNGTRLGYVDYGPLGNIRYNLGGGTQVVASATGILFFQTWFYLEVEVTFSASSGGSVTIRLNGQTVASISGVTTAANSNPCSGFGFTTQSGFGGEALYWDDIYLLNTTAPNNTFLGDVKIYPLYPAGNGRVNGFSRFGGTSSGNYTAVNENPPDGDTSYVYTATPGTEDCYTLTSISNIATVLAVQLNGYTRKDDTPSRVLALGVGNGTVENYNSGTSVNTTYTYILRQMDTNPLTSAAWAVSDFTNLQSCIKLIS